MAEQIDISKDLEDSLRQSKKLQGDTNTELTKSINLLSKINDLRDASIAKVKALNKETINTKDIQKELQKANEKEILTKKKLQDLERNISATEKTNALSYLTNIKDRKELEEKIQRARIQNNYSLVRQLGSQLTTLDSQILSQEQGLNIDERRYASLVEANKTADENIKLLEQELETEKEISKSIGISGKALGFFATKLGIGNKYFGDMVEKARDLNEEGKKLTFVDKLKGLGSAAIGGAIEAMTDPLTAIPIAGAAVGGLVKGLKAALDFILEIQDKTVKFARAMNLSTGEARKIKMEFASLSISSGDIFINSQKMVESQMELSDALGVTNRLTNEQLATNIKLKDIAGLDLETRKSIIEASTITGQESEKITKSVLAQVVGLKQTTGISFQYQKILKEASNLGGYLGLSFSKYPEKLTKSLVTVKSMGLELSKLDSIADSFLDFESSLSKEFEAQLLTGKDINLAKAREAFLNNDLVTAAKEITNQVGSAEEFLNMNRISAESLAQTFGMSRDEMGEMLKQQELLSKLGAKDLKDAQAKVQALKAQGKTREEIVAITGEEAYQSLINASAQEKIATFIDKIKQSFADFVEKSGIIEKIEGFINYLSEPENIKAILTQVRDFFATVADVVLTLTNGIINTLDFVTFGYAIDEEFEKKFEAFSEGAGDRIRSIGGNMLSPAGQTTNNSLNNQTNITPTSTGTTLSSPVANQPQAISIKVDAFLQDSARQAETRYSIAPAYDQNTSQYYKK